MAIRDKAERPPARICSLLVLAFLVASAPAQGQGAPHSSSRSTGGSIERRIPRPPPPAPPVFTLPSLPEASPSDAPRTATFTLLGVQVVGATAFGADELFDAYAAMLARPVGAAELDAIATRLVDRYRQAGYALVSAFAPPQLGENGIAVFRVIEGRIERIEIDGDVPREAAARIEATAAPMLGEHPSRLATLERRLLLIGDLPGIDIGQPRLRAIDAGTGRFELVIPARFRRAEAAAILDNRGSRDYGPVQLWTSGAINAYDPQAAWTVQAGLLTAPASPRELLYGQVGLTRSLGRDGIQLRAQLSGSRNVAGGPLGEVDARTGSARLTVGLAYPLLRARRSSLWGAVVAEAVRLVEDRAQRRFFVDELRVLRASISASHLDGTGASNWAALQASLGIDALGASGPGALRSRQGADARFAKLRFDAARVQPLGGPWSIELRAAAQIADDALFSAEAFELGGARIGRAFEPGALSGDHGIAGGLELRVDDALRLPTIGLVTAFAFADGGAVWNEAASGLARETLASAGFGLRARFGERWRTSLELAQPVAGSVRSLRGQGPRLYFSVAAGF